MRLRLHAPFCALSLAVILILSPASPPAQAATDWQQRGSDLTGEAAGDESGYSVSLSDDGTILAIGDHKNDSAKGQVRVYKFASGSWTRLGSDIVGEATGDYFGTAVSLSADGLTLAVGAPFNDGTASNAGHVRVFRYSAGSWSQLGSDLDGFSASDGFGTAVSLSSDGATVAIGAPTDANLAAGANAGQVTVYSFSDPNWTQVGARGQIEGAAGDLLGHLGAVALSSDGTVVAVGARLRDNGGDLDVGALEVYALSGGSWSQRGSTQFGDSAGDRLGYSVAVSADGTVAVAGAIYDDPGGRSNAGAARAFSWNGTSWSQRGGDMEGDAANDNFGQTIALDHSGTRVIVGSILSDTSFSNAGETRVFEYSASSWGAVGSSLNGDAADDNWGLSVAISGDGSTIAAGAHKNDASGVDAGLVRVYALPTTASATSSAGTPGIYLHVAGPIGRQVAGSPVYFGSDRTATTSTYLLSITETGSTQALRVLASGVVDSRGNLEARVLLPELSPGSYDVVFQGRHRGGAGLRLTARITIGTTGEIDKLGSNVPTLW